MGLCRLRGGIEVSAFLGETTLTKIRIPKRVTYIGQYAFNDCMSGLIIELSEDSAVDSLARQLTEEYSDAITLKRYSGGGTVIIIR